MNCYSRRPNKIDWVPRGDNKGSMRLISIHTGNDCYDVGAYFDVSHGR